MRLVQIGSACLSFALLAAVPVAAQTTATDTFLVSITLTNSCTVAVDDLAFPAVTTLAAEVAGTTTGTVSCTGVSDVSVSFDAGTGGASTIDARQMQRVAQADTIDYNLYRDASHTELLGDGVTASSVVIDVSSDGTPQPFTVYARTGSGQDPKPVGTYNSTITATVTF